MSAGVFVFVLLVVFAGIFVMSRAKNKSNRGGGSGGGGGTDRGDKIL